MKFGKHIQKRQLDIPEYAASFVDYKALKKLIKKSSATPVIRAQEELGHGEQLADSQASSQANKATFFFRLERELEKVNTFYLQKEAELKLRSRTLLDRKKSLQARAASASKLSSVYVTLDEGFRLFNNDLDKLQQFVEINQTAFSKILKKWDKTSKSRTKELYLSRAVEVQPCFNRDVISDLSDQATTSLLELGAWAEGEKIEYIPSGNDDGARLNAYQGADNDVETQIFQAVNAGSTSIVTEWMGRSGSAPDARDRVSRVFLATINTAPLTSQQALYDSNLVDVNYSDEINERSCLHEIAISGRLEVSPMALQHGANTDAVDVYGRIPLHYACMHGKVELVQALLAASPGSVDVRDLDNFTPLIHGIVHTNFSSVEAVLQAGARVDPLGETDHIPLNLACQYGSVPITDSLSQYKPQILPDAEGLYPQHLVPRSGRSPQISVMLRNYGANLDQPDKLYQWTPLFHAASEGHISCSETSSDFGVDVDASDEKNLSSMYYAAWEGHSDCLRSLEAAGRGKGIQLQQTVTTAAPAAPFTTEPMPMSMEAEGIPDSSLPPPIIPLRRYGHNFLDTTKTFIVISFDTKDNEAIEFYGDSKYPAARLTISSKSSDLIPRNVPLPIQDEFKTISFQIDNLETFSIDFDIFPTFGSKVIARGAASSRVFTSKFSSSGSWHSELFDPRLRAIGRISFKYQVVTPFASIPLEITQFATYWKATSQVDTQRNQLITGSSLTGDYSRVIVQATKDGIPVIYPEWALPSAYESSGIRNDSVSRVSYEQFNSIAAQQGKGRAFLEEFARNPPSDSVAQSQGVATSWASSKDALEILPPEVHLDIHIVYPTKTEEQESQSGPTRNINYVCDAISDVVFDHASKLRAGNDGFIRSVVFSSYNPDICTASNWKQPNYPVSSCNQLGLEYANQQASATVLYTSGRTAMSIKEAVRIAQSNNYMGLMCSSRLSELVPASVESIKVAGSVSITDVTYAASAPEAPVSSFHGIPEGVDGILRENAILRFNETIDM